MAVLWSCWASADVYSEHPVSWTPIQIVDCYCECCGNNDCKNHDGNNIPRRSELLYQQNRRHHWNRYGNGGHDKQSSNKTYHMTLCVCHSTPLSFRLFFPE